MSPAAVPVHDRTHTPVGAATPSTGHGAGHTPADPLVVAALLALLVAVLLGLPGAAGAGGDAGTPSAPSTEVTP